MQEQTAQGAAPHLVEGASALGARRSLSAILESGKVGEGEHTVLIPLLLDAGRTVWKNLTFDAGLLESIEAAANQRGITVSAFLASAAREKIEAFR